MGGVALGVGVVLGVGDVVGVPVGDDGPWEGDGVGVVSPFCSV